MSSKSTFSTLRIADINTNNKLSKFIISNLKNHELYKLSISQIEFITKILPQYISIEKYIPNLGIYFFTTDSSLTIIFNNSYGLVISNLYLQLTLIRVYEVEGNLTYQNIDKCNIDTYDLLINKFIEYCDQLEV